ncbi:phosphopantetheine-binding protein [Paenibacillus glucanolyticus]|uniref:phosphopantetheine-binding protein n=1 Tax=Paenibacillus glucanolyticus TaxID=59843 RepID=UPI0036951FDE
MDAKMGKERFYQIVMDFVAQNKPLSMTETLQEDTDLFETGLLDSFSVIEFIMYLENATNKEMPAAEFTLDNIKTMHSIYSYFIG